MLISFDGIDGSGKSWSISELKKKLESCGFSVWAIVPRNHVGSCREIINYPDKILSYINDVKDFLNNCKSLIKNGKYDFILLDRSLFTLFAWFIFKNKLFTPDRFYSMIEDVWADITVVLKPDLEICKRRTMRKIKEKNSHIAKDNKYWISFWDTVNKSIEYLSPKLKEKLLIFEDSEDAVDWLFNTLKRKKTHLDIHLTNRCNLKCPTCCFGANNKVKIEESVINYIPEIIENAQYAGIKEVHLLGGEPLLLGNKLYDIAQFIKSSGFKIHIITSGSIYKENLLKKLIKVTDAFFVSVDGDKDTHNKLRGENIFKNTIQFLKELQNNNIKIRIGTLVSKLNIDVAHKVPDILKNYGINNFSICWMHTSPTGQHFAINRNQSNNYFLHIDKYFISWKDWFSFVSKIKSLYPNNPEYKVEVPYTFYKENSVCELLYFKRRLLILSDGSVYYCPMLSTKPSTYNIIKNIKDKEYFKKMTLNKIEFTRKSCLFCFGGCLGYYEIFNSSACDSRCVHSDGNFTKINQNEKLVFPSCPCRTLSLSSSFLEKELTKI
ncbi:MAG: radical SAM protein [Candidatus Anstonellaceae archaeon]